MKRVLRQLGPYKKDALLCIGLTMLEVIMEILLPFITARIIDEGLQASSLPAVYRSGIVMVVLAFLSLVFGGIAGKFAASASSGLSANLREAIYNNIQTFSFSNIDKFSVPGLVTRMTTDVTNVQNAFMMVIRVAVRSPLNFLFSFAMCLYINRELSLTFLIAVAFLIVVIGAIMVITMKIFNEVFQRYDDLNASVQENVSAIRVVKAFVREDYEKSKFEKASANLYRLFVKADGLLSFNNPAMMVAVYFCIIMVSWMGAQFIVVDGTLSTGDLTSLFSYIMSLLMSLMMLSMVVVMIAMSMASVRRISEVLGETPDLQDPAEPVMEVKDGSIDFNHVNFSYKHGSGKNALSGIDLHVKSGETIGVIGGTGSGKSSLVNFVLITLLSLPCVLGYNVWAWDGFAVFGGAVLDLEDFLVSNLFLPLGSLVYLLFCVTNYGWGWDNYKKEVNTGKGLKMHDWMRGYLTCVLPVIVLFIFAFGLYDKFL